MKIAYSAVVKNPSRKNAPYYGRIRQDGREKVVPLNTTDRSVAMKWVERQKNLLWQVNEYLEQGESVPAELLAKLMTVDNAQVRVEVQKATPATALDGWETWMVVKGVRNGTVRTYMRAVRFLLDQNEISALSPASVARMAMSTTGLKTTTRHTYFMALKSLFTYMKRPDLIEALPHVKTEQAERPSWTEEQMEDIIAAIECRDPFFTEQYRLYFSIMAAVGSRQGETALLRWCDLKYPGVLVFRAETCKNRREKVVPIPTSLFAEIDALRPRTGKLDDIYADENNTSYIFPHIASVTQSVRYGVLSRALRKLGLRGGLHTWRHSCAELLYKKSTDVKKVAQVLGHGPSTAMKYYLATREVEDLRDLVEPVE